MGWLCEELEVDDQAPYKTIWCWGLSRWKEGWHLSQILIYFASQLPGLVISDNVPLSIG